MNSIEYGIPFGCLGAGAMGGAIVLPVIRSRSSTESLAVGATIAFAVVTGALAQVRHFGWLCVVMIAGGAVWIMLMASFNVATQTTVPSWVRVGRWLSIS